MTLPLHPLDQQLFTRAQALLDDEWIAHDADLAPVLPTVLARNVAATSIGRSPTASKAVCSGCTMKGNE